VSIASKLACSSMIVCCLMACDQRARLPVNALVPSHAIAMLELRWQEARSDRVLTQFTALPRPATVIHGLGVTLDAAETVIAFSTSLDGSDGGDTLIVSSRDVVSRFIAAASGRWIESSTGSAAVYDDPASRYRALIVSDSVLAIGPRQSIERVAATAGLKASPFLARSELTDLAEMFESPEPVRMAVVWPMEVRDATNALVAGSAGLLKLGGLSALGGVVEKFGIGRAVAMSCSRNVNDVRCRLAGVMQDESTASIVAGGLSLLKGLAGLVPQPRAHERPSVSMADLTVDRRGTTVTVGVSLR